MSQINVDIVAPQSGSDVTVDGNLIVTGENNILPYKVYTALISQTGTDNPTVVVLHNTIGNIVWSRNSAGNYQGYLAGEFLTNKTFLITSGDFSINPTNQARQFFSNSVNAVIITTQINGFIADNLLENTPIEIRVYN